MGRTCVPSSRASCMVNSASESRASRVSGALPSSAMRCCSTCAVTDSSAPKNHDNFFWPPWALKKANLGNAEQPPPEGSHKGDLNELSAL